MKKMMVFLDKLEESILIFLVSSMGIVLFLQIVMRFGFGQPLTWPEEFGRYCQVWITFLGIGYGIRKNTHVNMTILSDKFNYVTKRIVDIICNILGIYVSIVLLLSAIKFIGFQNVLSTALQIPMQFVYIIIPVSAVLSMLYYLSNIIKSIGELIQNNGEVIK